MNSPTDLATTTSMSSSPASPSSLREFLFGLPTTSRTGQSHVAASPEVDPTALAQAVVVVVIAPPLASFDFNGFRCEVFSSAHNLALPTAERRYYYSPALRLATTTTDRHHPAGYTDSQEEEQECEECEELDTRMVELVDGFYKVSLVAEYDPPAVRRLAMTTLQSVLPAADCAALALRESNLRALPVVRVGWRVVDPLPLDRIGVTFYHSSVPALTPGRRFPLELMVAGGESRARQVKHALARLTLTARLTFSARSVAAPAAAAAVAAHQAASAVIGATASQPTQSVMIKTCHLIASQAWRALWDRAQRHPPPPAAPRWPRSEVKLEAGVSGGGRRVVGARKSESHSLKAMMAGVLGWLGCEKTAFVGQVARLAREFRGEIGAQPTQRMLAGSAAAAKFEELTAKYVNSSSRRVVVWEHAARNPLPLRSEPLLLQQVDVCQAQLEQALNKLFVKATTTTTDEMKNGDDVSNDCYQFQAPRSGSSEAAHWALWGGWPANGRGGSWKLVELQRELREKCGVWVEACQTGGGRLVPVKLVAVVLSLAGLMPGGRERSIGCLHTTPATSGLPKLGPIFPDDGLRMHRELQLTNHYAAGHIDSSAAISSEETVDNRPLKRRKSEPDGDRTEPTDGGAEEEEVERKAKRRRGRDDEEDQLRCQLARMTETIARLTKDNEVLRQRERERATTETMRE